MRSRAYQFARQRTEPGTDLQHGKTIAAAKLHYAFDGIFIDEEVLTELVGASKLCDVIEVAEMQSNDEVWADWLRQENEYAVGDRKSMEAGAGKYLNFIKIVLRKKQS